MTPLSPDGQLNLPGAFNNPFGNPFSNPFNRDNLFVPGLSSPGGSPGVSGSPGGSSRPGGFSSPDSPGKPSLNNPSLDLIPEPGTTPAELLEELTEQQKSRQSPPKTITPVNNLTPGEPVPTNNPLKNPFEMPSQEIPSHDCNAPADPCQGNMNRKLDEAKKKDDNEPKVEGKISTQKCEKWCENDCISEFTYTGEGVLGLAELVKAVSSQLEEVRKDICKLENYAAIPEWWQVRAGANRPQLVILYAEDKGSGKVGKSRWSLTIPHFKGDKTQLNLPPYRKGQWEGILTLTDNSKLIVNAGTQVEADRVINALKVWIDPNLLKNSFLKIGQRKGTKLKAIRVKPVSASFFETGQEDEQPDWVVYFKD